MFHSMKTNMSYFLWFSIEIDAGEKWFCLFVPDSGLLTVAYLLNDFQFLKPEGKYNVTGDARVYNDCTAIGKLQVYVFELLIYLN